MAKGLRETAWDDPTEAPALLTALAIPFTFPSPPAAVAVIATAFAIRIALG